MARLLEPRGGTTLTLLVSRPLRAGATDRKAAIGRCGPGIGAVRSA
jgi:hypothetical protein